MKEIQMQQKEMKTKESQKERKENRQIQAEK
jgi:hypothetical protein